MRGDFLFFVHFKRDYRASRYKTAYYFSMSLCMYYPLDFAWKPSRPPENGHRIFVGIASMSCKTVTTLLD